MCVLVERKSRYIQLDVLERYDAATVRKTIEKRFKKMEPELMKTLTVDQGHENSEHRDKGIFLSSAFTVGEGNL